MKIGCCCGNAVGPHLFRLMEMHLLPCWNLICCNQCIDEFPPNFLHSITNRDTYYFEMVILFPHAARYLNFMYLTLELSGYFMVGK